MKVSKKTINFLADMITGTSNREPSFSEYKSGPELVLFFNDLGFEDTYGSGFPSRWAYTENKLLILNQEERISEVLKEYLWPVNFVDEEERIARVNKFNATIGENTMLLTLKELIDRANRYLRYDGYGIKLVGNEVKIMSLGNNLVETEKIQSIDAEFIRDNFRKVNTKIEEGDYSGAITNARSLLEDILLYVRKEITGDDFESSGDLQGLYKDVSKKINLAFTKETEQNLKQLLTGFVSIINGLSGFSNKVGDRHGKTKKEYKAEKHHAILIVNSAKTLAEFFLSSYEKQYR